MNLEFTASVSFRTRLGGRKELLEAVKALIRMRPKGAHGQPAFFAETLVHGGVELGVVYHRTGNRIGLVDIFQLPDEAALFELKLRRVGGKEVG